MRALVVAIIAIALVTTPAVPGTHTAAAQSPDPAIAFQQALARVDQLATWGETYSITSVRNDGLWAVAIAEPSAGLGGIRPHSVVPLIALLEAGAWQVIVPTPANAAEFNALINNLPLPLMDEHERAFLQQPVPPGMAGSAIAQNATGHKLPWPYGQPGVVTKRDGSGHVSQIDFSLRAPYAPGQVVATKPGTVVFAKESSNSGACDFNQWRKANIVVVQHGPSEYSWYVHLVQNSVPVNVGDSVTYGTKLGVQGETGYACGVHLHYMTSTGHTTWTDPANPDAAPWGTGVIATDFAEAPWDGLAVGSSYTSQNQPDTCQPPSQVSPADGAIAPTITVSLAWSAVAGCPTANVTLRVRTTPDMNGPGATLTQQSLGPTILSATVAISPEWTYRDLYWGVRAGDALSATWSVRRFRVEPPINGVYTLYNGLGFTGEAFSSNQTFADLVPLGRSEWARSFKVDPGVGVVACTDPGFRGDCARTVGPLQVADLDGWSSGLDGTVSSIRACAGACPPGAAAPSLNSPISGTIVPAGVPVVLRWSGSGDEYFGELSGGVLTQTVAFGWLTDTQRTVGALMTSPVPYVWRVRANNGFGTSAWVQSTFVVTPTVPVFIPIAVRK